MTSLLILLLTVVTTTSKNCDLTFDHVTFRKDVNDPRHCFDSLAQFEILLLQVTRSNKGYHAPGIFRCGVALMKAQRLSKRCD